MSSEKISFKNYELTTKILIGMVGGVIFGYLLWYFKPEGVKPENLPYYIKISNDILIVLKTTFINLLKLLTVPLVFFSLLVGILSLGNDISKLGRIGIKSFLLYLTTTALAISFAIGIALLINPTFNPDQAIKEIKEIKDPQPFVKVLTDIVPDNIINAFLQPNMLQIILIAIFFGIALILTRRDLSSFSNSVQLIESAIIKMVELVMLIAPYSIFAIMALVIEEKGIKYLEPMGSYIALLSFVLLFHLFVTLMIILKVFSGLSPKIFLYKLKDVLLVAFSTSSSNATMPLTLETLIKKIGIKENVASFTIPFGATVNMDGTAMMQGVATILIANSYPSISLDIIDYATIIGMSILASVGTAGVPGVGLIMLAMVFHQVGLPEESIAYLMAVDRIMDMMRTTVNVAGDAVVTSIVAKSENAIDLSVFYNMFAGTDEEDKQVDSLKEEIKQKVNHENFDIIKYPDGRYELVPKK